MTVAELIEILKQMPQDIQVEVNDNAAGEVFAIDQVDHFDATEYDPQIVIIQVNC
jgi:hypothetical protein